MMTGIIPCLYNSFSFTQANLEGGNIICYDIKTNNIKSEQRDCNNVVSSNAASSVPSLPKVIPEPIFLKKLPDSEQSIEYKRGADTETDPETDPETEVDTDTDTDTDHVSSSSSSFSASSCRESRTMNEIVSFDPNDIRKYSQNINETKCADSILWCLYIMMYGYGKFEMIDNYYTESNRFKFELIELLRQNKPILKANKLKISALEESLVHKPFITLETLHAVVVCKSMTTVYIIQDRKYYDVGGGGGGSGATTFILEKIKGRYVLYDAPPPMTVKYITYVKENYWRMESISAPIRPLSAYKLQDLIDISTKLGLEVVTKIPGKFGSIGTEKRKTKPELYESICRYV